MTFDAERFSTISRVTSLFGGSIQTLEPEHGTTLVTSINELLSKSLNRLNNSSGKPGGIVAVPDHLDPVIVGDLHGNVDNLLTILCIHNVFERLEKGTAALIFLGDAVHSEEPGTLAFMDSSLLMMDLIFILMLQYPHQVTYLMGNHDSFSEEIIKDGVPQGVLWEKHLTSRRGEFYRDQMQQFYQLSPLLAQSSQFLACHAGPPRESVSLAKMIDIASFPKLANDLVWSRVRSPAHPLGYTHRDVRRFQKSMSVKPAIPFVVGHSPLSDGATYWENIGQIPNHHLVYSAHQHQVGVFTRISDSMQGSVSPTIPMLAQVNQSA